MANDLNFQVTPRANTTGRPTISRYGAPIGNAGLSTAPNDPLAPSGWTPSASPSSGRSARPMTAPNDPLAPSGWSNPASSPSSGLFAAPMAAPNAPSDTAQGQASALASVVSPGLYGGGASPRGGQAAPFGGETNPALSPVLTAALGLSQLKQQSAEQDTLQNLARAGAIPSPNDSPEIRSNKFAYLTQRVNEQGAQALGLASEGPRAAGTPVYTGNQPGAPDPHAHAGLADAMALVAQHLQQQAGQPRYVEDPVTGERKFVYGNNVSNSGTNPAKQTNPYPQEINAGGRKLIKVSADRFTDEKGNPVDWRSDTDKPLSVNEFLMSPAASGQFGGDYGKYRDAFGKATKSAAGGTQPTGAAPASATPGAGNPTIAPPPSPKPGVTYLHGDVQAELKRRGLSK